MLKQGLLTILDRGGGNYGLRFSAPGYDPSIGEGETLFFYEAAIKASLVKKGRQNVADSVITPLGDNLYRVIGFGGIYNDIEVGGLEQVTVLLTGNPGWPDPAVQYRVAAQVFDVVYKSNVVAQDVTEYSVAASELRVWKPWLIGGAVLAGILGLVYLGREK